MNYIELLKLQTACNILSESIVARNAMAGWVDGEVLDRSEQQIRKLMDELKGMIEKQQEGKCDGGLGV